MNVLITADNSVCDNQWWKDLFVACVKPGDYFEIHCWQDEKTELRLAGDYGDTACYSIPDMKIVHGTMSDRMQAYLEHVGKPSDAHGYNKMVPFYTIRIGNHFSSEKYGTEIMLNIKSPKSVKQVLNILGRMGRGITVYGDK